MIQFLGNIEAKADAKGRVFIPATFRKQLQAASEEKLVLRKDVYQDSNGGKWVRYDEDGHMVKGWTANSNGRYYFDLITGAMMKGLVNINGTNHYFDEITGINIY